MKNLFAVVGCLHTIFFVLGSIGAIDYHVCIKGAGQCGVNQTTGANK